MFVQFKTALAVLVVASVPLHLGATPQASSSEPLSMKEFRKAEAQARTSADHLRLAAWYQSQARQNQAQLAEQEELVNYWAQQPGMASRTKIPNPYWNAQTWARIYREKLRNAMKLAAAHQRMAESLEASAGATR